MSRRFRKIARGPDDTPDWPHGQPTQGCGGCGGTGLDRARAAMYATSRAPFTADDHARVSSLVCPLCEGRGRVIIERARARDDDVTI